MITLDDAKKHLRVDLDDDDEDIKLMIETATQATADYLGGAMPDPMPAPVKSAILLQISDLYENRSRQGDSVFYQNRTYERLLNPYRILSF